MTLKSHSQKSATFPFDKSAKNVKITVQKRKKTFLVCQVYHKSIEKYWIAVQDIHLIFFKFESLKIV